MVYKIFNIGKNSPPGTTVNQEDNTLSNIATYSIQVNMEIKLYKSKINLTPMTFHKLQQLH